MAAVNWISILGRLYGTSLVYLVGLGYLIQGFRCFPWLGVNFYLKDELKVDPGTLQFLQNTVNLPMVAKPIYGVISDAVYIRGAHRVPYLIIGGLLQVISWGAIALLPEVGSSITMIAGFLALSNLGASIVEVANDALVAECSKKGETAGELQSFAWFSSAAGGFLGNLLGALALSRMGFKAMCSVFLALLAIQVIKCLGVDEFSFGLKVGKIDKRGPGDLSKLSKKGQKYSLDMRNGSDVSSDALVKDGKEEEILHLAKSGMISQGTVKHPSIFQQLGDLFRLVRQPEILYPLTWVVGSYAVVPSLTGTMFFYQTQHLRISPLILGLAKVLGQVALMAGSVVYSRLLMGISPRKIIGSTQILLSFCMLSDILLVKQLNVQVGIPNEVLVMGASAFVDAIGQFKVLPFMVLLGQLCPAGCEGSLLSFFMSIQCLANIVSGYLGVELASFLHISSNNFEALAMGIFIQAMAALLPLFWISTIPEGSKMPNLQSTKTKTT